MLPVEDEVRDDFSIPLERCKMMMTITPEMKQPTPGSSRIKKPIQEGEDFYPV
jgi:hypothetical protein